MKQEKIALSMSHIDDDLIIEAAEIHRPSIRKIKWQTVAIRLGGLAACLVLAVGLLFGSLTNGVTMDGQRLTEQPVPVSLTAPRQKQQPVSPTSGTTWEPTPEFSLDFSRSTLLSCESGTLAIVNDDGSLEPLLENQKIRGSLTLQLTPETDADTHTITTSRGYDIVLSRIEGEWYIHIEK